MKRGAVIAVTMAALFAAGEAAACGRPPLPPWDVLLKDTTRSAWIGRVSDVTPNRAPFRNRDFEVRQSTAIIETLEPLHGEAPAVFEFVGSTHVRARRNSGALWCGPAMTLKAGDIVLIVPNEVFGAYVLKPEDSPIEIRSRLEAHR